MPDYYNLIMGRNDSSFVTTFNKLLKKELESQNLPYTNAIQIENGNRLLDTNVKHFIFNILNPKHYYMQYIY